MRTDMALLVQTLDFLDQYVQDLQDAVLGDFSVSARPVNMRPQPVKAQFLLDRNCAN